MHRVPVVLSILILACGAAATPTARAAESPRGAVSPSPSPRPSASPSPALQWRNIGPAVSGGRVAAVAGTDADPNLFYAGAAGGGVWKSTNGGIDWSPVFDRETTQSIGSIAISPKDKNDVWVGTGEPWPRNDVIPGDGIYHSTDGGKTWAKMGLASTSQIARVLIDPRDPRRIVVAALGDPFADSAERGVFRTLDGGPTWTKTLYAGPSVGASDVVRDPQHPDVLFAGMWRFRRSAWHLDSGGDGDGIYKSTDGGATWSALHAPGLANGTIGRIGLAIAPSDGKRIYVLIESSQGILWRSDDVGDDVVEHAHQRAAVLLLAPRRRSARREPSLLGLGEARREHERRQDLARKRKAPARRPSRSVDRRRRPHDSGGERRRRCALARRRRALAMALRAADLAGVSRRVRSRLTLSRLRRNAGQRRVVCAVAHRRRSRDRRARLDARRRRRRHVGRPRSARSVDGVRVGGRRRQSGRDRAFRPHAREHRGCLGVSAQSERRSAERTAVPLQLGDAAGVLAAASARALHGGERRVRLRRSRCALACDQRRSHPQPARTADALRRRAARRHRRRDVRHDPRDRTLAAGRRPAVGFHRRRPRAAHARRRRELDARRDPRRRRRRTDPVDRRLGASSGNRVCRGRPHYAGDRAPYVYATDDFGAHWRALTAGLPHAEVHVVREDPRNPDVLYAGTGIGVWWSVDRGASWKPFPAPLPAVEVRDLAVQPQTVDLLAATHGRGLYVLDDPTALRELASAQGAGVRLFPLRDALPLQRTSIAGHAEGGVDDAPPATVTFYQATPAKTAPTIEIVDARGCVVRRIDGTHEDDEGNDVPNVPNNAGLNRVVWNLDETPPTPWRRAAKWDRGTDGGVAVLSGTYTVRLHRDGMNYTQPIRVLRDRRVRSDLDERAGYALARTLYRQLDELDTALKGLDNVRVQLGERTPSLNEPTLAVRANGVLAAARSLESSISSQPVNDQDNDFLRDLLRERVLSMIGNIAPGTPPQAQRDETASLERETRDAVAHYGAFVANHVVPLNAALKSAGIAVVNLDALPPKTKPDPNADERAR